jgi:hypothetical protein
MDADLRAEAAAVVLGCVAEDWRGPLATPCWLWRGRQDRDGYGVAWHAGRTWRAHRLAWAALSGDGLPAGAELDHLCRRRACVRPDHLDPVDRRMNVSRRDPEIWLGAVDAAGLELLRDRPIEGRLFDLRVSDPGRWAA